MVVWFFIIVMLIVLMLSWMYYEEYQKRQQLQQRLAMQEERERTYIQRLTTIGTLLSTQEDRDQLLEYILDEAKSITNSDGGTLYVLSEDKKYLDFKYVKTDSLGIKMGGKHGEISWGSLPLYNENNSKNIKMVATVTALFGRLINIPDVYESMTYDFEGTKAFDKKTGFRSKSMLVIPLKNHENELIGVLQLLNRKDETTGEVSVFSPVDEEVTRSLASQAAVTLTNVILVQDLENLLMAFIKSIASAIDKMSPYTGDHIRRVADIATLIAEKLNSTEQGRELLKKHKKTPFSKDEIEQIRIAALMHDVGKITTPVHVIDKSTKLETIYDRLHFVLAKLEILKRDKHIAYLEDRITKQQLGKFLDNIEHNVKFLRETNMGSELMSSEHVQHLDYIAKDTIMLDGKKEAILNENELVNLQIRKGTLTIAERDKINEHANLSLEMLEALPYPKKLRRVPEIGGNHHEQLNGKGYPRGLNADELSIEARLMAIADIFEALSSSDRPYKTEKTLSQCFDILEVKAKANEIDADLVKFIVEEGLHLEYAKKELMPHQIDDVTLNL